MELLFQYYAGILKTNTQGNLTIIQKVIENRLILSNSKVSSYESSGLHYNSLIE